MPTAQFSEINASLPTPKTDAFNKTNLESASAESFLILPPLLLLLLKYPIISYGVSD